MTASDPALVALLAVIAGVLGLAIGSFLNVVIWRVPRSESLLRPPSSCPACGHQIRWYDNVPLMSWIVLRRRCRDCRAPISARYPAVELLTALSFVAVVLWQRGSAASLALCYLAAVGIALAAIDLEHHRLPDAIVLPSLGVAALLLAYAELVPGSDGHPHRLLGALIGAVALFAAYFALMVVYPAGMGFGDVKLAALLGMYLGWAGLGASLVGGFAAFLLGGVVAIVLLLVHRAGRRTAIPFGPYMVVGTWIGLVWGPGLWSAYLGVFA